MFPFFSSLSLIIGKLREILTGQEDGKSMGREFNIIAIITYYYEIMHERRGKILTSLQLSFIVLPILRR